MSDIDRILLEMERRGQDYFDETMRIGRVMDLLNRSRVQQGFEQQVVADAPQQIERKVGELVDWLVDADLRQWQAVTRHLAERRRQYRGRIVGEDDSGARASTTTARGSSTRSAARRSGWWTPTIAGAKRRSSPTARATPWPPPRPSAPARSGSARSSRVAATTAAADVTGIILASVLAAIGFFILPAKRKQAKEEMRKKIADVRERLSSALREQFAQEIDRSGDRIRESIAPYSRFIRAEGDKLKAVDQELREISTSLASLRAQIERQAA